MYYQSYEDYMRDVLGYTPTYNYNMQQSRRDTNTELERLYPEIYRTVYPMVRKVCTQYNGEITEDFVERLTNEVYTNLEVEQDVRSETSKTTSKISTSKPEVRKEEETRQRRPNNTLRDLIRILIIRELLGGRPNRPGRPPFPGGPGGPGMPGGPGPRPPMPRPTFPRGYDEYDYMW